MIFVLFHAEGNRIIGWGGRTSLLNIQKVHILVIIGIYFLT